MKWLVTWIIISTFITPCEPIFRIDEYGRTSITNESNLVICWDSRTTPMRKYFDSYEDAKRFVDNAPLGTGVGSFGWENTNELSNFKITKEG